MKKMGMFVLALIALTTTACGGGASKKDACDCIEEATSKSACEATWDACDDLSGKDSKDCKDELKDAFCK